MTLLKYYGLVTSNYAMVDGYRRRVDITITPKGRTIIDGPVSGLGSDSAKRTLERRHALTISAVKQDIEMLREMEPGLEISFSVKLKEQPM